MNILLGDFNVKVCKGGIINKQLRMNIYTKLVMIMDLQ
jgi:hypothetical protein